MKKPAHYPEPESPLYWLIESRSEPGTSHLVYLGANDGRGRCFCTWFRAEVQPAYDQKRQPRPRKEGDNPYTCHHVEEAEKRFKYWIRWYLISINPNHEQEEGRTGP